MDLLFPTIVLNLAFFSMLSSGASSDFKDCSKTRGMKRSILETGYKFVLQSKDPGVFTRSIIPDCNVYPPDKNGAPIIDPLLRTKIDAVGVEWQALHFGNTFYTQDDVDFEAVVDYTVNQIQRNGLCNNLNLCYLEYQLVKSEMILFLRLASEVHGLAILNTNEKENCLMVEILCGSTIYEKVGTLFIDEIKKIAALFRYDSIKLQSVPASIMFYFKKGFHCNTPEKLCNMKLDLPVDLPFPPAPLNRVSKNKTANATKKMNKNLTKKVRRRKNK